MPYGCLCSVCVFLFYILGYPPLRGQDKGFKLWIYIFHQAYFKELMSFLPSSFIEKVNPNLEGLNTNTYIYSSTPSS